MKGSLRQKRCSTSPGFVLLEVLVSMTILAIAGTSLIYCFKTSIQAEKIIKRRSRAMYLTQSKMLDLEFEFYNVEIRGGAKLRGDYRRDGYPQFWWEAEVDPDNDRWAYIITVKTFWQQYERERFYEMTSLVPRPRYDKRLLRGRR